MGRSPCCSKEGLNRGAWTALEDKILTAYIKAHGEGKWRNLPKRAGLKRCGKSCRLRWLNYLRPDIKRGNISHDEEDLILRLHKLLGNRWSLIAGRLPGRTDNEIKNYWNTTLGKKAKAESSSMQSKQNPIDKSKRMKNSKTLEQTSPSYSPSPKPQLIRTKATKCTKVVVFPALPSSNEYQLEIQAHQSNYLINNSEDLDNLNMGIGNGDLQETFVGPDNANYCYNYNSGLCMDPDQCLSNEQMFGNWSMDNCAEDNGSLDLESLGFLLDSEEWPL